MTELVYSADRVSDAQALLTHQLIGKAVLDALIAADVQQSQAIEDAVAQLRTRLDIDTQTGAQLDAIGALVRQPRQGRQDAEYRLWLKARVLVNRSSGSPRDIYAIAYILLGANADLFLRQIPVGHVLEVAGAFPAPSVVAVQRLLQEASPIAVPFYQQYALSAYDRFELASGSTPVALSDNGYDAARMVDWIGPEQTPDPYANIAKAFGRRLVDCWDCRKVEYAANGQAVRIVGQSSEMQPLTLGSSTYYPTKGSQIARGTYPISLSSQKAFATEKYTSLFGDADPWSVALQFTKSADFDERVFEVANNPAIESGAGAYNITIVVTAAVTTLVLYAGGSSTSFALGAGVAAGATSLIVSYDGGAYGGGTGQATAWINGTQYTATGAHRAVPGLAYLTWGEYEATDDSVAWDAYKLALFDRVLTDAEAQHLTDILTREFTDDAYY